MAVPKVIMVTLVITLFTLAACRLPPSFANIVGAHWLDLDQAEKREEVGSLLNQHSPA
jgi:hypothetical protein